MNKILFILLFIPLILLQQSCTGMLVYFIEEEIVSSTSEDFNLTHKQTSWVKEKVSFHISNIRKGFINGFVEIIEDGNESYQDKLTVGELNIVVDRTRDHIKEYSGNILKDVSQFFDLISPEQYAYYKKRHKHDESDFDIDIDDDDDFVENTKENVIEQYEKMYGHLEKSQIEFLTKLYNENPSSFKNDVRMSFDKATFVKSIASILKSDLTPKDEKQSWVELFANPDKIFDSLGFDDVFESIKLNQKKFVEIDAIMDKDQRAHFSSKISRLTKKVRKYALR